MDENTARIVLADSEGLYDIIKNEISSGNRSRVSVKKEPGKVVFEVRASDATALRAALNSIMQLVAVHEKLKKIK